MNKAQASKIRTRLLAVGKALNKVDEAISELNKEDREVFADPMVHLDRVLRREALRIIYSRYPELQPGFDEISSDRRWEDVTLPPSISEADLDAAILSKLRPHFLKVAKVISDVVRAFDEQGLSIDAETISARIRLLADIDRIEGVGDLRKWRFSEVRLKD
jgi:hypothetical protein